MATSISSGFHDTVVSNVDVGGSGGSEFGTRTCPTGHVVSKIYGKSGSIIGQVCMTCDDGTDLGCSPSDGGGVPYRYDSASGWQSLPVRDANFVVNILGSGGSGGYARTLSCPDRQYLAGYSGSSDQILDHLTIKCAPWAKDWCVDHLEDPMCTNVDVETLNKACASNMSATCRTRRQDLHSDMVNSFCATHKDDPLCSCFVPPPPSMEGASGLPHCWNASCTTKGYIPHPEIPCPPLTICRQDISATGTGNILKGVTVMDCGSSKPSGGSSDKSTEGVDIQKTIDDQHEWVYGVKNTHIIIAIIVLVLVFIISMMMDNDDPMTQYTPNTPYASYTPYAPYADNQQYLQMSAQMPTQIPA